jgi:hypothetical protein
MAGAGRIARAFGDADLAARLAAEATPPVIKAYHGSPYDFDRFDASKIGTGEGAQAFGYGHYFGGHEDTAEFYRRSVTANKRTPEQDAQEFIRQAYEKRGNLTGAVLDAMDRADASQARAVANGMDDAAVRWDKIRDAVASFNIHNGPPGRLGRTYEVEINHTPEKLLNYERPFDDIAGSRAAAVLRAHNPAAITPRTLREIETGEWRFIDHAYGNPYQRVAAELHGLARTRGGAAALREGGVPGIKYLDEVSRYSGGDGDQITRNYVMFPGTEDSIRILRKYGMMAPIAAGATADE